MNHTTEQKTVSKNTFVDGLSREGYKSMKRGHVMTADVFECPNNDQSGPVVLHSLGWSEAEVRILSWMNRPSAQEKLIILIHIILSLVFRAVPAFRRSYKANQAL